MKHQTLGVLIAWSCLVWQLGAQPTQQFVERPHAPLFMRPYEGAKLAPMRISNSDRLYRLIRGGKLYLTVQDAIALAIEDNLDIEVDRYGPVSAEWTFERLQAGGPLRGVTAGNSLANQATSGQGVLGSQVSAGLATNNSGNQGAGTNAVISQIGPVTPNLDATLQSTWGFFHTTAPQPNTTQSQTPTLIDTRHVYNNAVSQGLISGGIVQIAANESYLKENTPTDYLNPSVAPVVQAYITHQFLQGFGVGVNSRFIRVAEKAIGAARETFRSQLLNVVVSVVNLYWDLVTYNADLKVRQRALEEAQKVVDDTRKQIELGAVPRADIYAAESQLSVRSQDLAISRATVAQQENILKDALSRNGLADPLLDAAEIVPLDSIHVPDQDELPPLRDLVARALANRPDVALAKIGDETAEISALGTANGVLPVLRGIASTTSVGLAGVSSPPGASSPYYVGGLGTALGQVFRHNFPSERGAVLFQGQLKNRIAQGDYGIDQFQLRQGDLVERRNMNQIVVDISNQMIALRQARARYTNALDGRKLQEQLLEKEREKFTFGASSIANLVGAQTSLLAAQVTEVAALAIYSHARVSLDQVLGETLEVNHVSVDEALSGRVSQESKLPPLLP
jgi:outer membrane protein